MEIKNSATRSEYMARINRAIDFIDRNLSEELSLEQIASIAAFSPYHFHRIFRAIVGEPLFQFIRRLRLEKAVMYLCADLNKPITEIAYDCGFSNLSAFSRAFSDFYGKSPNEWRSECISGISKNGTMNSNDSKSLSNVEQVEDKVPDYFCNVIGFSSQNLVWRVTMNSKATSDKSELTAEVEVKHFPATTVAYVRYIGNYKGNSAVFADLFGKLCRWAGPRGLINRPGAQFLSAYHDDPNVTDEDKLRVSVCLSVPEDTKVEGEIGKMVIPEGKYAVAHFEILPHQYGDAWNALCGAWLPESGYQPDDGPSFELYLNDPNQHPEGKHIVDIYFPVKPM